MKSLRVALSLVLALAIVACSAPGARLPTPVPALELPAGPGETSAEEPTTAPATSQSPAEPASQTDRADRGPAPTLVAATPAAGEELALDGEVVLSFDQAMNRASVEHALLVEPAVPLQVEWRDDQTLLLAAGSGAFEPDTEYVLVIDSSAISTAGAALQHPVQWVVNTTGTATVAQVVPSPDATDVAVDSPLRVVFDRPIVPLVGIQEQADLPAPIQIMPEIAGTGVWTNTSIYEFTPSDEWLGGTRYTVSTVPAPGTPVVAQIEPYEWTFTTALPRIIAVTPVSNEQYASPDEPIGLVFNQPMDEQSAAERFTLRSVDDGVAVPGEITWEEDTLVFTPQALTRGVAYEVVLAQGAVAASGDAVIETTYTARFRVAPEPSLISSVPRSGAKSAPYDELVQLSFSCPVDRESLMEQLRVEPKSEFYVWMDETETLANISMSLQPSTSYAVTVGAGLQDRFGATLGKDATITFMTAPRRPGVWLRSSRPVGLYDANGALNLYASAVNVSSVDFELYALDLDEFVALARYGGWPNWDEFQPERSSLLRQWSVKVNAKLNEVTTISASLSEPRRLLESGLYVVRVSGGGSQSREHQLVVVSPYNLVLKTGAGEAYVWATDLETGQPVEGMELTIYDDSGMAIAAATTDSDGLATAPLDISDPWVPLTVVGLLGDDSAVVLRNWSDGISPWEFDVPVEVFSQPFRVFAFSDRRIYRPGQTVYYKGYVRADDDGVYSLPPTGLPVRLEVFDSQGRTVAQDQLMLSENGTFDGAILLSESASLGYYYATVAIQDQFADLSFMVAEYRKPEFQGSLSLDKTDYADGDVAEAQVAVSYFFGGEVGAAQVVWTALKEPYAPSWEGLDDYTFDDYALSEWPYIAEYGGPFADGTGETGADGTYTFELPVDLSEDKSSKRLLLQASVIDANNQEVSINASAVLHKAQVYAGLGADLYVGRVGEQLSVNVITVDTAGAPLGAQEVTVEFFKHEWYSVQEETEGGDVYWVNKTRETAVAKEAIDTDERGLGSAAFTPEEGGAYRVRTTVRDAAGNENHSSLYLWVTSDRFINWGQANDNLLQLVADKDEYAVGDVARVLVPAPFDAPALAWVTVERGSVLEGTLVEFDGVSQIIEVPITEEHVPNIFLSVVMVVGSEALGAPATFKVGTVELPVDISSRRLDVIVTPGKATYQPRQEAEYTITTRDAAGRPVSAEVTLQLVDLAVETLVGGEPPSIMDAFYRERGLGVSTAASLTVSVDRANLEYASEGKGGGGGGDAGSAAREYFPDTAYWRATLVTDQQGRATVNVLLPDNLTTWRMRAQAMTVDSLVGSAAVDVITNLDLMVRPALPRFFVAGDEPELTAVVHNNTAQRLSVQVEMQATEMQIDQPEQTVSVPAGGKAPVSWQAVVTGNEVASITVSATGGGLSDAVKLELPILRATSPEVVATSGQVDERVTEQVRVPTLADPDWGAMVVLLEPSLAAGMIEGLGFLQAYPYDCTEQTISRFLPNIVTYRALSALDVERPDLAEKLPQQVATGLQRLYETQNLDGGWGWWAQERSDATLTAYAVQAMVTARETGFAVDDTAFGQAVAFLWNRLDNELIDSRQDRDERGAVLYALALTGEGDLGRAVRLFDERDDVSLFTKAYLAMTLALLEGQASERVEILVNELEQAAIVTATGAHWEEAVANPWSMSTDTRTTAMVLRALVQTAPQSQTLASAVRWLMTARSAARWETTQENAWAIMALTDYMLLSGELAGEYEYELKLNGALLKSGAVAPDQVDEVAVQLVPMSDLERAQPNMVEMSRDAGQGRLYYSAFLNYYLPIDQMRPLSRGIHLQRQYTFFDAAGNPVDQPVLNGLIEVRLTIIAPHDLYYVVIEDALPAGCEAIDPSLNISRRVDEYAGLAPVGEPVSDEPAWRQHWPAHTEFRDERVALFATSLQRGTYEYVYTMRCSAAGRYNVLPTLAYEMYSPDVMGRSAGEHLTIER